ncbi:hypothetical protein AB5I41_05680 [Sphingomonas sp. MMS24-JH45]
MLRDGAGHHRRRRRQRGAADDRARPGNSVQLGRHDRHRLPVDPGHDAAAALRRAGRAHRAEAHVPGRHQIFTVATLLCFFAKSLPFLLVVRAVQALGARRARWPSHRR